MKKMARLSCALSAAASLRQRILYYLSLCVCVSVRLCGDSEKRASSLTSAERGRCRTAVNNNKRPDALTGRPRNESRFNDKTPASYVVCCGAPERKRACGNRAPVMYATRAILKSEKFFSHFSPISERSLGRTRRHRWRR